MTRQQTDAIAAYLYQAAVPHRARETAFADQGKDCKAFYRKLARAVLQHPGRADLIRVACYAEHRSWCEANRKNLVGVGGACNCGLALHRQRLDDETRETLEKAR